MHLFVTVLLCSVAFVTSSEEDRNGSEIAVNIDGQLITLTRSDKLRMHFDPSEAWDDDSDDDNDDNDDNDVNGTLSTANKTDYDAIFHQLFRRSDDDDDDAKTATCMDNLQKFRMLAKNKPLQFVVVVEEGGEARLTCHFCEDGDKLRENHAFDREEAAAGKPLWRNPKSFRSPILWYRIRHFGYERTFRMSEVKPSLHDDEEANRIYVTSGHTLVVSKAAPEDGGTYFCRDTRTHDRYIKTLIEDWEIRDMMGDRGAFRFLIHLDVLQTANVAAKEVNKAEPHVRKNHDHNTQLLTVWGRWSKCSMCDQPGEQRRRGVCTVKKINDRDRSWPWYVNAVLTAQATGVPCRSSLFHTQFEDVRNNKAFFRPDEIVRRTCNIPCKRKGFFKNLLSQKAMSPKGLQSILSKKKKDMSKVKKINETAGATIDLKCPGATLDQVVMWMNGSQYMPGVTLANVTGGRVSVDINGTLHISPLTRWDTALYLCAVGDKETGHVFLNVTEIVEDEFAAYGMWVIYSLPPDFLVFLFLMVVKHRHRKRILISSEEAGTGSNDDDDDDDNNTNVNTNASTTTRNTSSLFSSSCDVSSPSSLASSSSSCSGRHENSSNSNSGRSSRGFGSCRFPSQTSI